MLNMRKYVRADETQQQCAHMQCNLTCEYMLCVCRRPEKQACRSDGKRHLLFWTACRKWYTCVCLCHGLHTYACKRLCLGLPSHTRHCQRGETDNDRDSSRRKYIIEDHTLKRVQTATAASPHTHAHTKAHTQKHTHTHTHKLAHRNTRTHTRT